MTTQLETSRLILREFVESDWAAVHTYASHIEVVKYMDWGPNTERDTKNFIQMTIDCQNEKHRSSYELAVVSKATGLLIGAAGIRIQDIQNQVGDFGYTLHRDFWGQGLGTEVARKLIHFGLNELNLYRIGATCRPENIASARVLEKAGLRFEGVLKGSKKVRGNRVDSCLYAIVKDESRSNPAKPQQKAEISLTIRDATAADANILVEAEQSIAQVPGFLISKPHELTTEKFQRKIEDLAHSSNGKYIVAEIENQIVGHALLDPLPLSAIQHVVHLTLVAHNGWQEKGVGKAMLRHLIEWAKQAPAVEKIELHVRSSNERAISLYRKLGFREEGRWKRRVKLGEGRYLDDVLMGLWVAIHNEIASVPL